MSSFGFSGTNAHIVLEQAPARIAPPATPDRPLHVYTLSARSASELDALVARHEEHGRASTDALADQCYTANTGRAHFDHRIAFIAESSGQLHDKFAASRNGQDMAGVLRGKVGNARDGEVVFLFTGQGAQYADMGRQLYETQPSFRTCLEHCDEVLRTYLNTPLLSALYPPHGEAAPLLDETAYTQPALFALEYALATLWQSWGIKPAAVIGHSVGEYVAACVAGVFSLEDGLRLVAERGRLMQQLPRNGEMAAVFADEARARAAIAGYAGQVSVAAVNGPANVVVSGASDAVQSLLGDLSAQGIAARRLNVSHAFHSPLIEPALDALELAVAAVTRAAPQVELVSNLTGDVATAAQLTDPAYWRRHSRETVRFADSVALLHRQGYAAFLEIGPSTTLSSLGQRCLPDGAAVWLPSLQKGRQNWLTMLASLGALYARGAAVDWEAFDRDYPRCRVVLPTYPFQRERYWVSGEPPRSADLAPQVSERRRAGIDRLLYEVVWQADARPGAAASQDAPEIKQIAERLHSRVAELSARLDMAQYGRMLPELDALCTAYIVAALRKLGYALTRGQQLGVDMLLARLGDAERHRRLIGRLLQILHEDGLLQPAGAGWSVTRTPAVADPDQQWEALMRAYPAMSAEITLTGRCARQLSDVLRGDVDPLQLLFPGGTLADTERLYQDSPSSRFYNTLIGEAVTAALARSPRDGTIRILEIGAGTGGTTSAVLPALAGGARPVEYVFTDISPMFTNKAKSKFSRYPFVRYATLDIGRDPLTQGFTEHQFDVIVAANVLHATPDVRQTLANVRRLLAPEGLLVLLEGTSPQRFGDLTVGLTPGWWAFSDTDLRPDYALLPQREWLRLLSDTGLVDAVAVPGEESGDVLSQQAVLMARNPRLEPVEPKAAQGYWLICADQGGIGQGVAEALRAHGQHVVLASAGAAYARLSDDHFQVDPARPADFEQLLRDARGAGRPACHGAVHLWPLDAHLTEDDDLPAITQAQIHACGSALHLTQALVSLGQSEPPHLWLATRGAQSVSSSSETHPVDANQATVWGLSHVISLEHPELRCTRVDLDAAEGAGASAAFLFDCIWKGAGKEDQVASRGGQRYVRRLARAGRVELTAEFTPGFSPGCNLSADRWTWRSGPLGRRVDGATPGAPPCSDEPPPADAGSPRGGAPDRGDGGARVSHTRRCLATGPACRGIGAGRARDAAAAGGRTRRRRAGRRRAGPPNMGTLQDGDGGQDRRHMEPARGDARQAA